MSEIKTWLTTLRTPTLDRKMWALQLALAVIGTGVAYLLAQKAFKKKANYKGKVVVITGASAGIGEELAFKFAKLGAKLVLAARGLERLEKLAVKCKQLGATDAIAVAADMSKEADCKNLIDTAVAKFGTIDMLLLNAGIGCLVKVSELKDFTPFKQVMDINFWGYVYPTVFALPHLRNSHGTIVAISSLSALFSTPRRAGYSASKKAIHGFFDCLRTEEPNIQVTIVCPGFVKTELHDKALTSGGPLERVPQHFMRSDVCAQLIIDAASEGKREYIMTSSAKLAHKLRVFLPALIDKITTKKAEASVLADKKKQ